MLIYKLNYPSTDRILLVLTFSKNLPNIKKIVNKHWHLFQIKPNHKRCIRWKAIWAYRINKNLRELNGSNRILNDRVVCKNNIEKKTTLLQSIPKEIRKWIIKSNSFTSYPIKETFKIFHHLNFKNCGVYSNGKNSIFSTLLKVETVFNLLRNNPRKDSKARDHFQSTV